MTIRRQKSLIFVDKKRIDKRLNIFGESDKLRVALHWQGNPDHEFTIARWRSFKLKFENSDKQKRDRLD